MEEHGIVDGFDIRTNAERELDEIREQRVVYVMVWNGFNQKLELFRGDYADLWKLVNVHSEEDNDVIYFYANIDTDI